MRAAIMMLLLSWSALGVEPSPRSAGLFFDAQGSSQFVHIEPYQTRTLYLVAFDFPELSAWEAQLGFSDPSFLVLATRPAPPTSVIPPWPACRDCARDAFLIDLDERHPQLLFESCAGINFPALVEMWSQSFGALKGLH